MTDTPRTVRAMGDPYWRDGWEWAGKLERELSACYYEKGRARMQFEMAIAQLTAIHSLLTPEDIRLPDGRVFRFDNPDIQREAYRALCQAIRKIPDDINAAIAQAVDTEMPGDV